MQTLILHTQSQSDAQLIIQLAERLGIAYSEDGNQEKNNDEISNIIMKLAKPIRKTLEIESLKKELGYKGVDRERFNKLVHEIDIQQSAEELIAQL